MNSETKTCISCKTQFVIEPDDFIFYEKFDVAAPSRCPLCRAQLRLAFKNERSYYKRPCDKCKRDVVSMYSPNKLYAVWCYDCWFADDWDARDYARDYDPKRPFLEQFEELWNAVPKVALIYVRSVRSDYVNISADNKNCYMIVESPTMRRVRIVIGSKSAAIAWMFRSRTRQSFRMRATIVIVRMNFFIAKGARILAESYFLLNCRDCSNCIGCVNLRSKTTLRVQRAVIKRGI